MKATLPTFAALAASVLAGLLASCSRQANRSATDTPAAPTNVQVFQVKGVLKTIRDQGRTALIRHEEIPDYMAAMTMPFSVKDPREVAGLVAGDEISFRLHVTTEGHWIDGIMKTGREVDPTDPSPPPGEPAEEIDIAELEIGDRLPDYAFTNELGQAVSLSDFKGRALAMTFIFTRCPLPEYCPLMSLHFAQVFQNLTSNSASPTNWHLLSISFDPEHDTPTVLRSYGERYQSDPRHWSFLTGDLAQIRALGGHFGLHLVWQGGTISHNLRTVVVDTQGRIQRVFANNLWEPSELLGELTRAADE